MKGLYIVTPDWDDTDKLLATTEQALRGGAALVQYRHKNAAPDLRREQARRLLELCRRHQRPFIVNDHVDLCLEIGGAGIHVGGREAGDVAMAAIGSRPVSMQGSSRAFVSNSSACRQQRRPSTSRGTS